MNYRFLQPTTIGSHAAILVVVLAQLITKSELSVYESQSIFLISLALPAMALAFILLPEHDYGHKSSQRMYIFAHTVAHSLGMAALSSIFFSFSTKSGWGFSIASAISIVILLLWQLKKLNSPAVKEAYDRVKKT